MVIVHLVDNYVTLYSGLTEMLPHLTYPVAVF